VSSHRVATCRTQYDNRMGRQDWEELLEANIKAGYSASNTAHLNAIKLTTKNLEEILEQQVLCCLRRLRCGRFLLVVLLKES
jgi:hypothetical protein